MNALNELRQLARDRRDRAIDFATDQYNATLARIAGIEQDLLGTRPPDHQHMSDVVRSIIPEDQEFTSVDVMAGLKALDPARDWAVRCVTNQLVKMRLDGFIRRLKRASRNSPAVYIRTDKPITLPPFEDKSALEAAEQVLAGGEMNATELTVALFEGGFRSAMAKRAFRAELIKSLKSQPKRFGLVRGKWRSLVAI
jgi:hypothetical protein